MNELSSLWQLLFGQEFTLESVLVYIVSITAAVNSITSGIKTKKLVLADRQATALELQVQDLTTTVNVLANIMCTAYLSNSTILPKVKQNIADQIAKLNQIKSLELTKDVKTLLDTSSKYIPMLNVDGIKEEALQKTAAVEEAIDKCATLTEDKLSQVRDQLDTIYKNET